ncbi:nitroreductase family protein [Sphingomonas sp. GlSt437]|uniref:nitroreductase family protein n=1 Tax=Sphingomonas sp. GlSt437 TaxID=3389970 RepID=UPI003A83FA3F
MHNDRSTPLSLLQTRRSANPRDMGAPGPNDAEIEAMITIAARTPDHGKLAPWRFVVVPSDARDRLAEMLLAAYRLERPEAGKTEIAAIETFAHQAPTLIVVLFSPKRESHIPLWEQELSAGAACMNLLHAAHAMGFVGKWLTTWAAYSDAVRDAFGAEGERIVGFVFIGSPTNATEERVRPDLSNILSIWGR